MKRMFIQLALFLALLPGMVSAVLFAPPTFVDGYSDHLFEMGYERDGVRFGFNADGEDFTLALEISKRHWDILNAGEKALFIPSSPGNYIFGYTTDAKNPWAEAVGIFERRDAACFAEPLTYESATPIEIGKEDLQDWVSGRKVLFYSGAGISKASGIPDMEGLEKKLGISSNIIETVILWVHSPELIGEGVIAFYNACQNGDPSKSHLALSHLAYVTNQQILTENLDPMHERMGNRPLRISRQVVIEKDHEEDVDAIICVGLSKDDKGFLNLMKQRHPDVKIIAVNPVCPIYLGDEDMWCPNCAHEVLETLLLDAMTQRLSFVVFNK